MDPVCATRALKNARFLQGPDVGFLPRVEPIEGFQSLVPFSILRQLERIQPAEVGIERLAAALAKKRPPSAKANLAAPLFSGTLRFIRATFVSSGASYAISAADLSVAMKYAGLAAAPISAYCSQYGPNGLSVDGAPVSFQAPVTGGKYNDSILSGWVDQLAKANGFGPDTCLVFLNPQGVVNTDADATQGVLGYHSMSSSGVPYAFVNVLGSGLTVQDGQDYYALALSHEIAEMDVDPLANGSNLEVADPCSGNCQVDFRNYFDSNGNWLGGSPLSGYYFFTNGIAKPDTASQCPSPEAACTYPPPRAPS